MSNLAEEYPKEQARCRELLEQYKAISSAGSFGVVVLNETISEAEEAAVSGDLPRMLKAFVAMQGCE